MDQPQPCTKCKRLPQDILMLSCSHDLCLDCAAERLSFQMKKKKKPNSVVCEICFERTPLDPESIAQLEKIIPATKSLASKNYVQPKQPQKEIEQTQPCIKCKKIPEDILMLSCNHDLCLACASERLAFQMKLTKTAKSVICEICYERTTLDTESVASLKTFIPGAKFIKQSY